MLWQLRRGEGMMEHHVEIGHVFSEESFTSIASRKQQRTRRRAINFSPVTKRRSAHARSRVRERETGRDGTHRKVQTGTDVTQGSIRTFPLNYTFSPSWLHEYVHM